MNSMTNVLATLNEIAEAVMDATGAGSLQDVLQRIAVVSQKLVHAKYAALGVPDGRGGLTYFETVGISPEDMAKIDHLPEGHGMIGAIMEERKALRLEHMRDDPRSVGFPAHHPHMDRLLGVPIQVGKQLFGTLYLCDRQDGKPFDEQDQWLVETLAGYAALAIAGAQLSEQQRRVVLLEERDRVSMELHDGTIQSLYAVGMQLQLMRLGQRFSEEEMTAAIQHLDSVIEDIRKYILNLKLNQYQQQTISACLSDLIARMHIPPYIEVKLDAPDRILPFTPPVVEGICQIAAESLSNVVRHAEATQITIRAYLDEVAFTLVIADNGRGFDVDATNTNNGMGLRNIHKRTHIYGGDIDLQSVLGEGTRVTLSVPVKSL